MSDMRKLLNLMESAIGSMQPIHHVSYVAEDAEEEEKCEGPDATDGENSPLTCTDMDEAVEFTGDADLVSMLDAAKRGLALANTLRDPMSKRKHQSQVLRNLNRIRFALEKEINKKEGDRLWNHFANAGRDHK